MEISINHFFPPPPCDFPMGIFQAGALEQVGATVLQYDINSSLRNCQFGSWVTLRIPRLHAQVAPTNQNNVSNARCIVACLTLKRSLLTIMIGGLNIRHVTASRLATADQKTHSRAEIITNHLYCHCIPHHKCSWEAERGYLRVSL